VNSLIFAARARSIKIAASAWLMTLRDSWKTGHSNVAQRASGGQSTGCGTKQTFGQ
jgi:hypothetical protein